LEHTASELALLIHAISVVGFVFQFSTLAIPAILAIACASVYPSWERKMEDS
jgi:hypothetical protein